MSTFFNSAFVTSLQTGGAANAPVTVRMYVWPTAPLFDDDDTRYTGTNNITDVATLSTKLGWGAYVPQLAPDVTVNVNSTKSPTYYICSPNAFDLPANFPDTRVAAMTFVYMTGPDATMVGKIMFTTNTLFVDDITILHNNDGIIPAPDTVNIGATNNRWMMFWSVPPSGPIKVGQGEIVVQKGTPTFEAARTQHVWLYPQRINMVANPSFEAGTTHWKKSGTLIRAKPGIDSAWYGHSVAPLGTITTPGSIDFPGTAGNNVTVAGVTPTTGDMTIVIKLAADDWTPAIIQSIVDRYLSPSGQRGWALRLNVSGTLYWVWSTDGIATSANSPHVSTVNLSALANSAVTWLAMTFQANNGAAGCSTRFWTGSDGVAWTQLGTTVTSAGTTSIFNTPVPLTIGEEVGVPGGAPFAGNVFDLSIRTGTGAGGTVGGTEVFHYTPADLFLVPPTATTITSTSGHTMTLQQSGTPATVVVPTTGTPATIVLESNTFPVMIRKNMDEGWTVHITARGDGELKVGLVTWTGTYDETTTDWGPVEETWALRPDSWLSFRTLRRAMDVSTACLRLETQGTFLDFDHVCCEPGFHPGNLNDWPYFDGDTKYGALDDYSWYGEATRPTGSPTRQHKTYSCWYNHRRAVTGRLFQWSLQDEGPGSVFTDEEVAAQGLVYGWVPAGTPVRQHLDVIYPGDPQSEIPDVVGPPTQRQIDASDPVGVSSPWLSVTLPINSAVHAHTATTVVVVGNMTVHSAIHSHFAESFPLVKNLAVQDSTHGHIAGNVNLTGVIISIPVDSTDHLHRATTVELTSGLILVVQNAAHTHTAQAIVMSVGVTTQNTLHNHTAANVILT